MSVHCAHADSGTTAGLRSTSHGGEPDLLPSEPGGYDGHEGLFGGVYVNQVTSKSGAFTPATADDDGSASTSGGPGINFDDIVPTVKDGLQLPLPRLPVLRRRAQGTPELGADPGQRRQLRLPGLRPDGGPDPRLRGLDAGGGHSGHVRLHRGRPRKPLECQRHGVRTRSGRLLRSAQGREPCLRRVLPAPRERRHHEGQRAVVFTVEEADPFAGGPPTNPGCDGVNTPCHYTPPARR